jgi:hypothetical protein
MIEFAGFAIIAQTLISSAFAIAQKADGENHRCEACRATVRADEQQQTRRVRSSHCEASFSR